MSIKFKSSTLVFEQQMNYYLFKWLLQERILAMSPLG